MIGGLLLGVGLGFIGSMLAGEDETWDRPQVHKRLYPGDILCVKRWGNLYRHYGVYAGHGKVIHYAGTHGDWSGDRSVREVPLKDFMRDAEQYMICAFPVHCDVPGYHLFSKKETVQRACSRLGEHEYDLIFNNCEHFAIWCRTNVAESKQTKRVEDAMQGVLDYLDELNAKLE